MQVPPDPMTGPDRSQDAFDFSEGAMGLPADLARQIREAAESLTSMGAEQRRHLTIAMTAVGATWIAPVLAARRRRKRRRRKQA